MGLLVANIVLPLYIFDLIVLLSLLEFIPVGKQELLELGKDVLLGAWHEIKFIVGRDVVTNNTCVVAAVTDVLGNHDLVEGS